AAGQVRPECEHCCGGQEQAAEARPRQPWTPREGTGEGVDRHNDKNEYDVHGSFWNCNRQHVKTACSTMGTGADCLADWPHGRAIATAAAAIRMTPIAVASAASMVVSLSRCSSRNWR